VEETLSCSDPQKEGFVDFYFIYVSKYKHFIAACAVPSVIKLLYYNVLLFIFKCWKNTIIKFDENESKIETGRMFVDEIEHRVGKCWFAIYGQASTWEDGEILPFPKQQHG